MKIHRSVAVVVGMATLGLLSGCDIVDSGHSAGEVVIAADLELSGASASIGTAYERALRLRIEQLNQEGALGNRRLTLVVRDNRSDENTSVENIAAFAADPSVSALITGVCAECVLAATGEIEQRQLPTIALALPAEISSPTGKQRYLFKLAPNVADDATTMVADMATAGVHTLALAATTDGYGRAAVAAVTDKAAKAGITIVHTQDLRAGESRLSMAAAEITAQSPDAVAVLAFSPFAVQAGKALRDAGYDGRLFFDAAAADNLFVTGGAASAVEGAAMVFTPTLVSDDIIATSPAKAARQAWFRSYLSKYGSYAAFASFAADAVSLIVQGVSRVGSTDRDGLRAAIETTRLDGLSGPIRLTPDNHSGLMPQALTMLVATNGRWRLAN